MEIINHEYYVSLEVAKLLKEAGFDWECRKIYYCYYEDDDKWELEDNHKNHLRILELDYCLLAPTLEVAQRWLREVKKAHIEASPENDEYTEWLVCVYDSNHTAYSGYKTYEEALEAGIKKALEMILEKGE